MAIGIKTKKVITNFDLKFHIYFGFLIRFALIMYGEHHDRNFRLKYTDVDYYVFTDAAHHVSNGNSPYERYTYRYTPFLAFILLPNVWQHFLFGKFLFSLLDCVATKLISNILILDGHSSKVAGRASLLWLYNPLVVAISTRGSSDSILAVIILVLVYFLKIRLPILSGVMLGLAVHVKLYPVIYMLPIYLSFTRRIDCNSIIKKLLPNTNKLRFLGGLLISFFGFTGMAYLMYEDRYIEEALLYHFRRIDIRHNFSVYFYLLYLSADRQIPLLSFFTFVPQIILVCAFGYKYGTYRDLPFCFFMQTVAFVTFNRVVTSQYFIWYLFLLPIIAPRLDFSVWKAMFLSILWLGAQASWLLPAYLLEFHSVNAFVSIWLESIAFFCCNIGIILAFIKAYHQIPVEIHHVTRKHVKGE